MNFRTRGLLKLDTNANSSAFTAKTALALAPPSGNTVVKLAQNVGGIAPALARFVPFGVGSDNDVFSMRVWGWTRYRFERSGLQTGGFWLPTILFTVSCTLSAFTGIAGCDVGATERFADTITVVATVGEPVVTADTTNAGTLVRYSPANDTPAWVMSCLYGSEYLEFDFDQTTGTPTSNCLVQVVDETGHP